MRIRTILTTMTLLGAALHPAVASAAPATGGTNATCPDERTGGALTVTVNGTTGNDNIWASNGQVISAQAGDDRVFLDQITDGPFGSDVVVCGDGENDWIGYFLAQPTGSVAARGGTGADTLLGGSNNDYLNGNAGTDNLFGNDGDDRLKGEDGNDNLWGGDGNDVIDGGGGHDVIDGGPGHDKCIGGEGTLYTVNCEEIS
ncbi:calcium-binding protein [Actinomadura roseirufa]|uniref:calcium-binding protein n=1 Tax=Actinomadura roseirufa TaxID=2094049 RepID=UPI0013F14FBB|nr:calcium-binding protein [Actinomadura roseirufa]